MLKRLLDVLLSTAILVITSPVIIWALWRVWSYDRDDPFYRAPRVGLDNVDFIMLKIRSMSTGADKTGLASTSANDARIIPFGLLIRRWKLDELSQFLNVLRGDMSVVGPRPQIRRDGVDRYTPEEMRLLNVKPGITDLSSIVFSDEGEILAGWDDPHAAYEALIRPWKSRLGLFYVDHHNLVMDLRITWLTFIALFSKSRALVGVDRILAQNGADLRLREVCRRDRPLEPTSPPGATAPGLAT